IRDPSGSRTHSEGTTPHSDGSPVPGPWSLLLLILRGAPQRGAWGTAASLPAMTSRWLQLAALAVLATACRPEQADPLAARGANELAGVAAGLVSDEVVCAGCHSQQAEGYRTVAMSRSTSAPGGAAPEGELLEYFHGPSGRHYRLEPRAGRVWFSRWIEGPDGERRHLLELPVDFVVGSGAHARSYVVRTAGDELFLLPVTWYEGL